MHDLCLFLRFHVSRLCYKNTAGLHMSANTSNQCIVFKSHHDHTLFIIFDNQPINSVSASTSSTSPLSPVYAVFFKHFVGSSDILPCTPLLTLNIRSRASHLSFRLSLSKLIWKHHLCLMQRNKPQNQLVCAVYHTAHCLMFLWQASTQCCTRLIFTTKFSPPYF